MSPTAPPLPSSLPLLDEPDRYGRLSRLTHWGGALLVLTLLALGQIAEELPKGPERKALWAWHIAIGVFAFLPLLARLLWRVQALVSGHAALLAVLALMIVTGPLMIWSDGAPIHVLGWFALPTPIGEHKALHYYAGRLHGVGSTLMIVLVAIHLVGALRHGTASLRRMAGRAH
jgi:cytochrome b561